MSLYLSGYVARDNHSRDSIVWLEWVAHQSGAQIQHALNGRQGEYRVQGTNYKVDGYCQATNTIYEYLGCLWHGCPSCYVNRSQPLPKTNEMPDLLLRKTEARTRELEALGYIVISVWEHTFHQEIKDNEPLRLFADGLDITSRLDMRDSFFGGRTNATKLYHEAAADEAIRYVDFTSLYPYVNKYARYPVGHPEIVTNNFQPISSYFGLAKVKVLPPRGLYHPVLPHRFSDGKLKFPLCGTCAASESTTQCTCTDEERALVGTWCTPELEKAEECGYKILRTYEVYHWTNSTRYDPTTRIGGLFASFIDTFLKMKQEASGWPEWCDTEEKKQEYITAYAKNEGINLEYEAIEKNPGKRTLAKLLLNSFWGKFGQRPNMTQTKYVYSQAEFLSAVLDKSKNITDFHIVNEQTCLLEYVYEDDQVPDSPSSNIIIATFTTCWARLKLLEVLHTVNHLCLYFDTDSIIYADKKGSPCNVPVGDYLGQLTNELEADEHIVQFVSGGPKNYGYLTNKGNQVCKVKGFSLNYRNSEKINFGAMKDIVVNRPEDKIITEPYQAIARNKRKFEVFNRQESKDYRMVYTKRRRVESFDTVPYGY